MSDRQRVSRQRTDVAVSLVNTFTNCPDVKGDPRKKQHSVRELTDCLSGFLRGRRLGERQSAIVILRSVTDWDLSCRRRATDVRNFHLFNERRSERSLNRLPAMRQE
jgi:hypothetical protein